MENKEMKSGVLEVLVVSARGIKRTKLIGKPVYYVILECGAQTLKSKMSLPGPSGSHDKKAYWNEKFTFQYPLSQWTKLTHLKLTIMDKRKISNGGFVGQTIIHLGGIVTEGTDRGFIELIPSRYNVVLGDDSYKGEIKIGFKFIANRETEADSMKRCQSLAERGSNESIWRSVMDVCKNTFGSFFFSYQKLCFSSSSLKTKKL